MVLRIFRKQVRVFLRRSGLLFWLRLVDSRVPYRCGHTCSWLRPESEESRLTGLFFDGQKVSKNFEPQTGFFLRISSFDFPTLLSSCTGPGLYYCPIYYWLSAWKLATSEEASRGCETVCSTTGCRPGSWRMSDWTVKKVQSR